MMNKEEVDFSKYDDVEILYREDSFSKYVIPFYAFYKKIEDHMYGVIYVPAVKVGGLEEYFKSQESWHNNQ